MQSRPPADETKLVYRGGIDARTSGLVPFVNVPYRKGFGDGRVRHRPSLRDGRLTGATRATSDVAKWTGCVSARPGCSCRSVGGGERIRTADFHVANVALCQLSYTPGVIPG